LFSFFLGLSEVTLRTNLLPKNKRAFFVPNSPELGLLLKKALFWEADQKEKSYAF
jgi:hypothetical protein